MYPHPFSDREIRPRLGGHFGSNRELDRFNLALFDRHRRTPTANDLQNPRRNYDWAALRILESTKYVAWEKRLFHFLLSIRPFTYALVLRKKALESLRFQLRYNQGFLANPALQCVPRQPLHCVRRRSLQAQCILQESLYNPRRWATATKAPFVRGLSSYGQFTCQNPTPSFSFLRHHCSVYVAETKYLTETHRIF
jgi:hypothetical protein